MSEKQTAEKRAYQAGDKLWWKGSGYGYEKEIPAVALGMSITGLTCKIIFTPYWEGAEPIERWIRLSMLERRND